MKDQCKQAVAQALGKQTLNAQEVAAVEKSINKTMQNLAREDRQKWQNMSLNDRISAAGQRIAQDILGEVRRKNKIAANDIIIQARNLNQLDHPSLPASQVVDRMIAPHGDMSGIQSFSSQARAIAGIYRGELMDFYTNIKGGIGVWTDKALVHDIIKERFGESSGNASAKQISDKMGEVFEGMRERFNRSGGDIGKLDNWALPQTHSAQKMVQVGKDQWVREAETVIDREMYVKEDGSLYSDAEIKALLEYSYDSITSNGANKLEIGRNNFGGNSKVTSKHSESRVLHFKNADAWLEYQEKYGGMQFVDLVAAHIRGLSKDIALVENLGSNPKGAMRILMDAARKSDWGKGIDPNDTKKGLNRSQVMFDEFMGANMPENEVLANIGLTYRSTNVGSMLGGTTLAATTDQAMTFKTAQIHDIAYRKIFGEIISQLNPKNKADRELAHSLGLATDEMLGSIARWSDDGLTSVHGKAEKAARISSSLATQVLRLSGLNALTAANKVGFSKMLMDKYGRLTREKSWNDLDALDRELLQGTGLNERTWEIMRLAEPVLDRKGNQLMSARSIYQIPDDKILAAMDGDVRKLVDDINNQVNELNTRNTEDDLRVSNRSQRLDDTKRQLSQRLQDYANRKDSQAIAEKQALQDRMDLLDAQKEAAAAQADMNTYLRTLTNTENLKGFMDGITQGKAIDRIADSAKKLGKELESLNNKVHQKTKKISDTVSRNDKEIQSKFNDFSDLLNSKTKLTPEQLKVYESKLADRLNSFANTREVKAMKQVDILNEYKSLVELKQGQITKEFEIKKAVEQSKLKSKTDAKLDSSITSQARQNYTSGESIGKRIGNAERRMVELRAKIKKADSEANKAIQKKYNELDKRIQKLDNEFSEYQTRVNERQLKREQVSDRLTKSIDGEKKELAKKLRDEAASRFQAHLLDEQGMAVIEAGLREKTWMTGGLRKGTAMGEILRSMLQFKSFPAAMLMRHGSRTFSRPTTMSKATYGASLVALTSLLGAFVVQLREIVNGNDPLTMWDSDDPEKTVDFMKRSIAQGGGLAIMGDIVVAGMDPTGRSTENVLTGPFGSDVKTALNLTFGNATQLANGIETNAGNEAFKAVKGKIPGQNLWYTKAVMNRMIFDELQDTIAPGYREKVLRKAERQHDKTRFWGDDLSDIQTPDFERVVQ